MVKLQLIKGGKPTRGACPGVPVRLFSACTVVDNYHGRDGVKINWVRTDRERPIAPYDELICEYEQVDGRVRPYFEQYIDELLSEEEVEALRAYLCNSLGAADLVVTEESVPISSVFIPMPYGLAPAGNCRGSFKLFEKENYSLPFKVSGFFDLKNCPESILLQNEPKEAGLLFLQQALKLLGFEEGSISAGQLEAVVETVYDRFGLFAKKGKTKEERTATT